MPEKFISEAIKPVIETCDTNSMSIGMPGLPKEFIWRGEKVISPIPCAPGEATGACRHGSGEQYARRQWFEVKTARHGIMKIYFNRSTLGRTKEMGWWLYTINFAYLNFLLTPPGFFFQGLAVPLPFLFSQACARLVENFLLPSRIFFLEAWLSSFSGIVGATKTAGGLLFASRRNLLISL